MPTSTPGLILYDIVHYLWLAFPIVLLVLVCRSRAWWTSERASFWARIVGGMISSPGVILAVMAVGGLLYAAARTSTTGNMARAAGLMLIPGAFFFGLGSLVFRRKKIALPVVSVLVALNVARFLLSLSHTAFPYTGLVWISVGVALLGQALLIRYLYTMRQWGYFQ